MKKIKVYIAAISVFAALSNSLFAELRLDYYYDQSDMYTKFSDWLPKQLHQWHPQTVEDFFLMYGLKMLYGEPEIRRNIYFLNTALERRFRHPSQALCKIETREQYHKYRLLMFMHLNLMIMRSYLSLGALYDKRHLYFYNLDFADDLKVSFSAAGGFYQQALPYWKKAREYAQKAGAYKFDLDLQPMESIRFDIQTGEIDYDKIIAKHIASVKDKEKTVADFLGSQSQK
ncbi:MAG: hypothetical protein OEV66_00240 [Spirochaetia bacterium]|nr:hypothetical protein [Spirochaetia bacterium]